MFKRAGERFKYAGKAMLVEASDWRSVWTKFSEQNRGVKLEAVEKNATSPSKRKPRRLD